MSIQSQPLIKLNDGHKMPQFGLGTYVQFPSDERMRVYQSCRDAIKAGYRLIDTAYFYWNEDQIGMAINDAIRDGDTTRNEMFVVSKLAMNKASRAGVRESLTESLRTLGLAYVDLFLIHWPTAAKPNSNPYEPEFDDDIDLHTETWLGMEDAVRNGLTKSIGVSNYNARLITNLVKVMLDIKSIYTTSCCTILPTGGKNQTSCQSS